MPRLPKALITPKLLPVTPAAIITAGEWLLMEFISLLYIMVVQRNKQKVIQKKSREFIPIYLLKGKNLQNLDL